MWSKYSFYSSLLICYYEVSREYWALAQEPKVHFVVSLAKWVPSSSMVRAMCRSEYEILLSCDQVAFHACFDPNVNTTVGTKSENEVWILYGLEASHKGKDREAAGLQERTRAYEQHCRTRAIFLMPDLQTQSAYMFRNILKFIKITTCWQYGWEVILCLGLRPVMQNNFWHQNYVA